jgi:electron transport complex protein RnfB
MSAAPPSLRIADSVAIVDEQRCIGCTLCINACPVDAIIGAPKRMHSVVADWCTGCELCVPPCPVDCIDIRPIAPREVGARKAALAAAQRRHQARNLRLERIERESAAKGIRQREERKKRETIARAVQRARERLASRVR